MANMFQFSVVTAERTVFEGEVSYVDLPTPYGSVGILARHAPMLCAVEKGIVRCTLEDGGVVRILVGDGVASIADNEVTVLASDGNVLTE